MSFLWLFACTPGSEAIRAALGPDPAGLSEVVLYTSTDQGVHWTLDPRPIAHGISSLHACTWQGTVWVPGLLEVQDISWMESAFPSPFVDVLRSSDLVNWTADRLPVSGPRSVIDPACVVSPSGLELWFAEVAGNNADPAQGSRPATIWRTRWNGERFEDGEAVLRGAGLVDPAPIYIDGALRLFLNQDGVRIVERLGDSVIESWAGVSVPQAVDLGTTQWLLAQKPQDGGMFPVARTLVGNGHGATFTLPIGNQLRSCESPSMTTLGDTWALFCVDTVPRRR